MPHKYTNIGAKVPFLKKLTNMKYLTSTLAVTTLALGMSLMACSCCGNAEEGRYAQTLFKNMGTTEQDFRIPAITLNAKGELVAFADRRYTKLGQDIGFGAISVQTRISADNGKSWSADADNPTTIIEGLGGSGYDCAHGDVATVCDRESGRILALCASGSTPYWEGGGMVGRYYSEDGGRSFSGGHMTVENGLPEELEGKKKFFSSGRICQSKIIKKGSHYRIYSAIMIGPGSTVYASDDFGASWFQLAPSIAEGNESKVEELPDGSLLHSCRISGRPGRIFRLYKYTDDSYTEVSCSDILEHENMTAASCNGEILLAPLSKKAQRLSGKEDARWIMLQSVPCSNKRENVSIYYKVFGPEDPYTDIAFWSSWDACYQVSQCSSAYSSMTLDSKGNVAFIYEENNIPREHVESYDINFISLPIETLLTQAFGR